MASIRRIAYDTGKPRGAADRAPPERGMPHGKALQALARKRLKVIYAIMRDRVLYAA